MRAFVRIMRVHSTLVQFGEHKTSKVAYVFLVATFSFDVMSPAHIHTPNRALHPQQMERKQHKRPTTIMQEHPEFTRTSAVYVSTHQEEMKGLLDSLSTQEVRESCRNKASLRDTMCMQSRTGVIYASARAKEFGWTGPDDPLWGNLGQGAPETQPLPNQPERNLHVDLTDETNEYSSVNGRSDLREAVANYYNKFFRSGKESQYSPENVAIVAGGRAGLSRLMCTLHNCNVGYSLPDYTAYSQLLGGERQITKSV